MHLPIHATWDGSPIEPDERALVRIGRAGRDWTIEVDASFHADPPPAQPAGSCPQLWTYEVVECFLVGDGERYLEVELGPHGHYLLLSLAGARHVVRQGMQAVYDARIDAQSGRWHGLIRIQEELVPRPVIRVNAFAQYGPKERRRQLCFSPLPGARADFHQIGRFPSFIAPTDAEAGAGARAD